MFGLIGNILLAAAGAAIVGAIILYIYGEITRDKIEDKLRDQDCEEAIIKEIDKCNNVVTLKDLNGNEYEIHGDSISNDLYEDQRIYV